MDLATITDGADRFVAYIEELASVIGHADRVGPLRDYCAGLLTAEGRKSVEPMAAVTAPADVSAQHQKLLHFVGEGKWSDERVLAKVRELVMPDAAPAGFHQTRDENYDAVRLTRSSARPASFSIRAMNSRFSRTDRSW